MKNRMMIILPKMSAYMYKEDGLQQIIETQLKMALGISKTYHFKPYGILEDMLALNLLGSNRDVHWYTVLSEADKAFLKSSVEGVPDVYWALEAKEYDTKSTGMAVRRYKPPKLGDFVGDMIAYRGARLNILQKRVKYVVDERVLSQEDFIYYINANNNYCKTPWSSVGDGHIRILDNVVRNYTEYIYGGVPLCRKDFDAVMEGLSGEHI